jgi:uncharacterized membrane protein
MAFIFYILLVLALFDKNISKKARYVLLSVFTTCLILSHYSTGYVLVALVGGVLVVSTIIRFFNKSFRARPLMIGPIMLSISFLTLFIWQVAITQTAGKISTFVTNKNGILESSPLAGTGRVGQSLGTSSPNALGTGLKKTLLLDADPNVDLNLARAAAINRHAKELNVYPDHSDSGYELIRVDSRRYMHSIFPSIISWALSLLAQAARLAVVSILPVIGIIILCRRLYRAPKHEGYELVIFSAVSCILIVAMIFFPYLQIYYNFTRLYLQMFLVLSVISMIGAEAVLIRFTQYRIRISALVLAFVFCSFSGAFDSVLGGQARITTSQPPSTFDALYLYDSEIAGARWLAQNRDKSVPVHADIMSNLRLQSFGNMDADTTEIFPQTIDMDSYIYMSRVNIERLEAFVLYSNKLLSYNYPLQFIDDHKDLIYNAGGSKIYK